MDSIDGIEAFVKRDCITNKLYDENEYVVVNKKLFLLNLALPTLVFGICLIVVFLSSALEEQLQLKKLGEICIPFVITVALDAILYSQLKSESNRVRPYLERVSMSVMIYCALAGILGLGLFFEYAVIVVLIGATSVFVVIATLIIERQKIYNGKYNGMKDSEDGRLIRVSRLINSHKYILLTIITAVAVGVNKAGKLIIIAIVLSVATAVIIWIITNYVMQYYYVKKYQILYFE